MIKGLIDAHRALYAYSRGLLEGMLRAAIAHNTTEATSKLQSIEATKRTMMVRRKRKSHCDDDEDVDVTGTKKKVRILEPTTARDRFDSDHNSKIKSECMAGLTFVFTGQMNELNRDEAHDLVTMLGGRVTTAVSRNTDYLVIGPVLADGRHYTDGSKYRKATTGGNTKTKLVMGGKFLYGLCHAYHEMAVNTVVLNKRPCNHSSATHKLLLPWKDEENEEEEEEEEGANVDKDLELYIDADVNVDEEVETEEGVDEELYEDDEEEVDEGVGDEEVDVNAEEDEDAEENADPPSMIYIHTMNDRDNSSKDGDDRDAKEDVREEEEEVAVEDCAGPPSILYIKTEKDSDTISELDSDTDRLEFLIKLWFGNTPEQYSSDEASSSSTGTMSLTSDSTFYARERNQLRVREYKLRVAEENEERLQKLHEIDLRMKTTQLMRMKADWRFKNEIRRLKNEREDAAVYFFLSEKGMSDEQIGKVFPRLSRFCSLE